MRWSRYRTITDIVIDIDILHKMYITEIKFLYSVKWFVVSLKCFLENIWLSLTFLFFRRFYLSLHVLVVLVQQELLILPENLGSPCLFCGVRVVQYLGFCVVFCIWLIVFLSSFNRRVVNDLICIFTLFSFLFLFLSGISHCFMPHFAL